MLLKLGPDSIKALLEVLTNPITIIETIETNNHKSRSEQNTFSIYGTHQSMSATSRSTITMKFYDGSACVISANLEVNPGCKWTTDSEAIGKKYKFDENGRANVAAAGIARAIGSRFYVTMSGYVKKTRNTIGYESKVEHCRVVPNPNGK